MSQFTKVRMSVSSIVVVLSRQRSCRFTFSTTRCWSKFIPTERQYSSSAFKVRLVTDKDDDLKSYFMKTLASAKRRPGLGDINSLLSCDPTGVFVGELDGKPVCTLSLLKYGPSLAVMSCYVVEKEVQGQGYGAQLCEKAFKTLSPSHNLVGYSVDAMLPKYRERLGANNQWSTPCYDIDLPTALQILRQVPFSDVYRVQTIDDVDIQALFNYDTSVFGYARQKFLQTFLHAQGSHVRVAINKEGVIVGYAAARVAFIKKEGYRLGPLYADSLEIAQVLLKALFVEVLEKGMSSSTSIWLVIPVGKNTEAKKLIELLDGKVVFNLTFATTKGIPKGRFEKWFAITSADMG